MSSIKILHFLIFLILWYGTLFSQDTVSSRSSINAKIAPGLLDRDVFSVRVLVEDSIQFTSWMAAFHPTMNVKKVRNGFYTISSSKINLVRNLQQSPFIKAIDRSDREAKVETLLGEFDQTLNGVRAVQSVRPSLSGSNMVFSVKEKPFDPEDIDLRGRTIFNNQFDEPATLHATYMATIAGGAGNSSPMAKGVASNSGFTTSDFSELLPDDGTVLGNLGVSVQNHSYGVGIENYYGIESQAYDQFSMDFPKILHVFSSGNDGNKAALDPMYTGIPGFANLTGQFKVSKNALTVGSSDKFGAVAPLSSRGPAHDGRIKPELVAFGDGGSSESAAVVTGTSVLVQQAFVEIYNELPDASLVKAVLINSADDSGRPQVDFETGFGNINALRAVRTVEAGNFFSGMILDGEEFIFPINITDQNDLVKITLAWMDPPANALSSKALINDLDMMVRHIPTLTSYTPWVLDPTPSVSALSQNAVRGVDRLNNVEQITIDNALAGLYEIVVSGFDVSQGPQPFYIAFGSVEGFEWIYPSINTPLSAGGRNVIRWQWEDKSISVGTLQYKSQSATSWIDVDSNVNLHQHYYDWQAPDLSGVFQLRMSVGAEDYESSVFALSKPDRLNVGFNCEQEIMLLWDRVDQATSYRLYVLGDIFLEPFLITADTFAVIQKNTIAENYFSVAPLFGTLEGQRELTIDYETQGTGCYFISFLPRQSLVSGSALFDVYLGSTYKLQDISLERKSINGYSNVHNIQAPFTNQIVLRDDNPKVGVNTYRVRLTTDSQSFIYSNDAEILAVPEDEILIFPNPVLPGQEISIVLSDEEQASIKILNMQGGLVREVQDFGITKSIPVSDLAAGTYLLKVQRHEKVWVKKIILIQ